MGSTDWDHENLEALSGLQKGDVEPMVELLEDLERRLHPELRRWLAAMLRGDTQTRWRLDCKRHPGFQKSDEWALACRDIRIGLYIHCRWHEGATITEAKNEAAEKFERESRTIDNAWTAYRQLYFRLMDEGTQLRPDLKELRASGKQA